MLVRCACYVVNCIESVVFPSVLLPLRIVSYEVKLNRSAQKSDVWHLAHNKNQLGRGTKTFIGSASGKIRKLVIAHVDGQRTMSKRMQAQCAFERNSFRPLIDSAAGNTQSPRNRDRRSFEMGYDICLEHATQGTAC